MQKKKAIVYPFDLEFCPIIRHKNRLKNYEIVELVSPNGFGLTGKDASFADRGSVIGMIVQDDYSKSLEQCDTVIFNDSQYYPDLEDDIYEKMKEAIRNKKNIVSFFNLEDKHRKDVMALSESNLTSVKFLKNSDMNQSCNLSRHQLFGISELEYQKNSNKYENICKIETPVIFVSGMTERTSKFEIQLTFRDKLEQLGYKISQIGSRDCCELLGFHSFPNFMFSNFLSEVDKIVAFNEYVRKIERDENPDIIILGIPGGTMKISNEYTNKFGVYAYEISQAIQPDYVIMSTIYGDFKPEYFDRLNLSSKYKFGFEVDCFNLSNVQMDWKETIELNYDIYINLDSNFVSKKAEQYIQNNIPVYNIFDNKQADQIVENILEKLGSYAEMEIV